jgi:hypothetical protein
MNIGAEENIPDTKEESKKSEKKDESCQLQIDMIMESVKEIEKKIEAFKSHKESFEYKHLDEMLTRNLEALDAIETDNQDLRVHRKNSVETINRCIRMLDSKASANNLTKPATSNEVCFGKVC